MNRRECLSDGEIRLLFTQESDRRLIYDLSIQDKDIVHAMFDDAEDFKWEEMRDAKEEFFDGRPSRSKYLLIEYNDEIVGFFCHDYHDAKVENMEFHIWMRATKYTGKGIGTRVLNRMIEYIHETYAIKTFIMRPWTKNPRAIRTYEKCGFKLMPEFELDGYFTEEEIKKYGNGAYTEEETANMVLNLQ